MSNFSTVSDANPAVTGPLSIARLADWFIAPHKPRHAVGIEVEYGLVRADTGISVSYDEPGGTKAFVEEALRHFGGEPVFEQDALIGVVLPDGGTLTLEMAGAVEYSSAPTSGLTGSIGAAQRTLTASAAIAERLGLRVLSGGQLPFDDPHQIKWAPKVRTQIMRDHFARLGGDGGLGDNVMGLTLSTQMNFDALSADEYLDKLAALTSVSPFLAALLANSPSMGAGPSVASQRMQYWERIDPSRCQGLTARIIGCRNLYELAEVLADLPMIYVRSAGSYAPAPAGTFGELLQADSGYRPLTIADWTTHLAQIWPSVRPRRTLETRLVDGQSWRDFGVVPAMFVGLVEDPPTRGEVRNLLADFGAPELGEIAVEGASRDAEGTLPPAIREICAELVRLASRGLEARVAQGLEEPSIVRHLEPARAAAASGRTGSQAIRQQWTAGWHRRPADYVAAMAVPAE